MYRSPHTVTKYLSDKTHAAVNSKLFKKPDHVKNSFYQVEFSKATVEYKEPIVVEFFILQYATLRLLELYCNFFIKFCDVIKFDVLEMDTDSLYLALADKKLEDCIRPELRTGGQRLRSTDCIDGFTADAVAYLFPQTCCLKHKQHDNRGAWFLQRRVQMYGDVLSV